MAIKRLSLKAGVLCLEINCPQTRNALTRVDMMSLSQAVVSAQSATDVKALLLCGAGAIFSSGVDHNSIRDDAMETARAFFDLLGAVLVFEKPLAVNFAGGAVGGGWLLGACADFCIAAPGAEFSLPEMKLGVPAFVPLSLLDGWMPPILLAEAIFEGSIIEAEKLVSFAPLKIGPVALALTNLESRAAIPAHSFRATKSYIAQTRVDALKRASSASLSFLEQSH